MKMNGSEPPIFETDADRTYFTVILPVHRKFVQSVVSTNPVQVKPKTRKGIEEIKSLILATLADLGNLSSAELAKAMGYTKVTDAVGKAIKELMEEEKIVFLYPEHPRSRNQKLCLVQKID